MCLGTFLLAVCVTTVFGFGFVHHFDGKYWIFENEFVFKVLGKMGVRLRKSELSVQK